MNQELEQYLRFFVDHRQKDWPEWLASAEFAVNNKVYTATKMSPFMANYGRELRMGGDIRKKKKVESAAEFVERMKKVYEETGVSKSLTVDFILFSLFILFCFSFPFSFSFSIFRTTRVRGYQSRCYISHKLMA